MESRGEMIAGGENTGGSMMAIKMVCDHVDEFKHVGEFMGG
ncbi:MAG: hypothetical protein Q8K62_05955 [Thiobacillus sp.]|nr:hypothetical protein [Thiobacillus sp.]